MQKDDQDNMKARRSSKNLRDNFVGLDSDATENIIEDFVLQKKMIEDINKKVEHVVQAIDNLSKNVNGNTNSNQNNNNENNCANSGLSKCMSESTSKRSKNSTNISAHPHKKNKQKRTAAYKTRNLIIVNECRRSSDRKSISDSHSSNDVDVVCSSSHSRLK